MNEIRGQGMQFHRERLSEFIELIEGDCLEVLPTLKAGEFDAVVTDPPYMIGAISTGGGNNNKSGSWVDMENSAFWFAECMRQSKRVLKQTGYLGYFGNWRSLPTLICALSKCDMPATSCLVWDKEWIGPAGPAQLRPTWELVLLSAMPQGVIANRNISDIIRCKWMAVHNRTTIHPAEKPVDLMRHLIRHLSPPKGRILDTFAGSGTTAEAAHHEGRHCLLIEKDAKYCQVIRDRVARYEGLGKGSFLALPAASDLFAEAVA